MSTRLNREIKLLTDKAAELRREAETCYARAKWLGFVEEHGPEGVKVLREIEAEAARRFTTAWDQQIYEGDNSLPSDCLWPGDWSKWNTTCHLSGKANFTGGFLRWLGWRPSQRKGDWA